MAVEPRWSRRENRERDRVHSELPYIWLLDTGALHIDTDQSWVNVLFLFLSEGSGRSRCVSPW